MSATAVFDDLAAELDRIEALLGDLDDAAWRSPSAATGWSVADVVLHLAQTEEAVVASTAGTGLLGVLPPSVAGATSIDDAMSRWVAAERDEPVAVFDRWRAAHRAALAALRAADPGAALPWAAAPLRPATLATTRLAEHWAHALDVTTPLGIAYPDTDRLRHVARLAHRTLAYGFQVAGVPAHDVYAELTAPDGESVWAYGDPASESRITGPAGDFCRVGAQRLHPGQSRLVATGPHAAAALRVLRTYAA